MMPYDIKVDKEDQVMTLTEKNEKLQDLRNKLAWLRTEELAVEESIRQINQQYRDEQIFKDKDLFTQMFEEV